MCANMIYRLFWSLSAGGDVLLPVLGVDVGELFVGLFVDLLLLFVLYHRTIHYNKIFFR